MSQNVPLFEWDQGKHQASQLIAEDELTNAQIATICHVDRRTLTRWKENETFLARVEEIRQAMGETCLRRAIARKSARVRILDEQLEAMQRVIKERGDNPTMADIPGGKTGLLVIKETQIVEEEKNGKKTFKAIPTEVAVDTALLKEIREHMRQAAQELGQWTTKHEHTGADGGPIQSQVTVMTDAERAAAITAIFARLGQGKPGPGSPGQAGAN